MFDDLALASPLHPIMNTCRLVIGPSFGVEGNQYFSSSSWLIRHLLEHLGGLLASITLVCKRLEW